MFGKDFELDVVDNGDVVLCDRGGLEGSGVGDVVGDGGEVRMC